MLLCSSCYIAFAKIEPFSLTENASCQTDESLYVPVKDQTQPADSGKVCSPQLQFSLPQVANPRGRPRQLRRLTTFNSKRAKPKKPRPARQTKASKTKRTKSIRRAAAVLARKTPAFPQNVLSNVENTRPSTPDVLATHQGQVEVSPHKVI